MIRHPFVALVMVVLAGSPAGAAWGAEFAHPGAAPVIAGHDCTCRYHGEDVGLGELRCLDTGEGPHAAQCVMEQNVTSWHPVTGACPEASLSRRRV